MLSVMLQPLAGQSLMQSQNNLKDACNKDLQHLAASHAGRYLQSRTFEICTEAEQCWSHVHEDICAISRLTIDAGTCDHSRLPIASNFKLTSGVHVLWVGERRIVCRHWRQSRGNGLGGTA